MGVIKYYINSDGIKCVDIKEDKIPYIVDIKGWSRIFQYSNRDLVLKEVSEPNSKLKLYDTKTNKIIAIYDDELDLTLNNKKAIKIKK